MGHADRFTSAATSSAQALSSAATTAQAHEAYVAAKRRLHEGCTL